ncbi:hypothetical protein [uncultured Capnocytophaga sp.]|uniref:hypothetical protein n=1 Tax=uncultured Capnocytophaga sp. TaxID=159273 RepID=UPI002592DF6F|nr:hypothetical protein [uncultured Capnocytophaga sp.]
MPDEKIKITKGTPSHTLGERLKFKVINPISKNEGYYLWNVFTYNDEEKEWKPIRTTNGKSYKFECHFEKESSDGVTFQVRVYKNDKKPEIEENTLLDFIEVTPHKRIEKAPKIISTHFFPEGEYDTNNKVSVYDSLHLRAKTEGLTGKEIQFHVCQEENGKEIVKDTVSARVDHTDYATTKIKLPIDTIKSILTNKNQGNQKDYYIKASFGLDKNGKKSTGEITKTYFIDKQGNPIEKISIGDTIRVCIDSRGEITDYLRYTIYEKDKRTSDDLIFQSPKFKLNNNHFFCREIVVTKELFNKGYGVSHAAFDSDYNVQDYYIKVERFSGSANSKTFAVTSDILKVHYGKSAVKVTVDDKKEKQLPFLKDIFLPALKIETANKISLEKEPLHIAIEKQTYQILSPKSIMDIKQDGRARYIDIPITRIDRNSMYIHFSLFHLGERKNGYIYPIVTTLPNAEKRYNSFGQIEKSLTGKVSVNGKERTTPFGDLIYKIYPTTTYIDFEITITSKIDKDIYIDFFYSDFSSIITPTTDGLIFKIKLPTKRSGFDIDAAVTRIHKEIDERPDKNPTGSCAKYVRYGLESGGINTSDRPNYACNYGPFLLRKGFNQINITDPNDYTPIKGDIVVFDTYPGQSPDPAGHIQIYNGEKWVSDFVQRRFWPGTAYENDYKKRKEEKREVNFKIFRW